VNKDLDQRVLLGKKKEVKKRFIKKEKKDGSPKRGIAGYIRLVVEGHG